jgi:hypothetical protein
VTVSCRPHLGAVDEFSQHVSHVALQLADSGVQRQRHMVAECLFCQLWRQQGGRARHTVVHKHTGLVQVSQDPALWGKTSTRCQDAVRPVTRPDLTSERVGCWNVEQLSSVLR